MDNWIIGVEYVATLALGSRPMQGFARLRAKREVESRTTYSRECEKVWGNEPSHPKGVPLWELESRWTPKSLEGNFRGQNSMAWGVLYINKKLLECKYLKWARIAHLDIWNTSYGQKKGRESKEGGLPTTKSRESTRFPCMQMVCDIPLESLTRDTTLLQTSSQSNVFTKSYGPPKSRKSQLWRFWDSHLGVPGQNVIWMWAPWRGAEYTIREKVVASAKSGAWWVLCVHVAHGSS